MAANYSRLDNFFRRRLLAGTAAYGLIAVGSMGLAHAAGALPQGGQVIGGSATINYASPSQLNITSTTNNSAIAWQSFSIGQGNSVTVAQPSANSTQLEQVSGPSASQIFGSLSSNGRIVVANPNGIWFGPSAQVDVAGLVATTAHANAADVAAFAAGGSLNLSQAGNATASVVNQGSITISQAGLAAFVAPGVRNDGVIQAKLGKVQLASGTTTTVDFYGDGLINLAVTGQTAARAVGPDGKPLAAAVQNTGTINADGGTVLMTANVAAGVVDQVINTTGIVQARAVAQQGGQIILDGGDNGAVMVAGTVDASGRTAGQIGGTVNVLGNSVQLASNAVVDVSGDAGGGTALIGGNFHGSGTQRHAATTTVAQGAKILADAVSSGNGGQVAIWADQSTSVDGTISAKGGAQSGNGGQVETSGAQLSVGNDAVVDASAANGAAGNWDLDPSGNLYLNSTNTVPTGAPSGSSSASTTTIATTLNSGTNVNETANQDLFVISPIAWSTNAHLALTATHSMYIEAPITATGASAELDLSVNGGTDPWTTLANFGTLSNLETGRLYVLNSNFGNVSGGVTLAATDTLKIDGTTYTLITNNTDFGNINLASGHYALDADLNAPSVSADWSGTFSGVLEGLGHTISNVNIAVSTGTGITNVGLFGQVGAGGVINDLNLASATVTTSGTATVDMGGIAGMNNGIIANVSVNNTTITSNPTTVPNQTVEGAGGIVGVNGTTGLLITSFASGSNLTSAAKGAGSGSGHVYGIGGAIGANLGAAVGSYAQNATLTSTNSSGVGTDIAGFVGFSNGTILADLYFGSALTITGHNITQGTFAAAGNCISGDASCTTSAVTVSETGSFTKVYDGTTSASGAVTASGLLDSDQFVDLSAAFPNPNVGSYTLSVDGITVNYGGGITHNYYYTVGLSSATGTITPAPLTITANNVSTEYGTTPVALTGFMPTGLVNGEAITSVTETDANNLAGKDAGTYTNSIVITSGSEVGGNGFLASNYSITLNPGTLTITPSTSPVVITANNVSTEYGTTPVALTGFSVTGLVAGNTLTSVTETDAFNVAAQDAGTYANSIIASGPTAGTFKASNYSNVTFAPGTLTITPSASPVTITANNVSTEYGTTPVALTGFSVTGLVAGNTLTSVTETDAFNVAAQDAGTYANSIVASNPVGNFKASNYTTVNFVNGNLTITPSASPVTITANNVSTEYGTTPVALTGFSVTGLVAGNTLTSVTETDAFNVAAQDAGTYANSIVASNPVGNFKASNYTTVNFVNGNLAITPSQSPVVITANNVSTEYGTTPVALTGFSVTGLVAGNTLTSVTETDAFNVAAQDAGTYTNSIIASGPTAGTFKASNYSNVTFAPGTLTITPSAAPVTITANNVSTEYGTTPVALTGFSVTGLVAGNTLTSVTETDAFNVAAQDAGTYANSIVASNPVGNFKASNYTTVNFVNGNLTITPSASPVTITANNVSTAYGTTPVALTGFSVTGLVAGNTLTSVTETDAFNVAAQDAGTYANSIIASGPTTGTFKASNYSNVIFAPGTLTITPSQSPVVITANNVSTEYGTTPVALTGFSVTGLVAGNTLTSVTETDAFNVAAQDAGTYANSIIASGPTAGTFKASNYSNVTFAPGTLTITPSASPVTITANNVSTEYGTTPVALTGFSVTGLVAGNTLTSVTETDAFNVAAQDAGTYANSIVASNPVGNFKASNYTTVNFVNGNLTITPSASPVTITANNVSTEYGTTPVALTGFSVTGLVAGNTLTSVTETDAFNVAAQDAGTYANSIVASNPVGNFKASNYTTVNFVNGTLAITPSESPVVITALPESTQYGTTPIALSGFSATGLVAGNSIGSVTLTDVFNVAGTNAGTYANTIIASNPTGNFKASNYSNVTFVPGTFTITPSQSPVVITAADQTQNFGSPVVFTGLPPQFSVTGLVAGNTITSVNLTSSGDTATAPAGAYSIIPTGGTGNFNPVNYAKVSYVDGTLTVLGGLPICAATFPQCTVPLNVIQLQAISNPGQSLLANVNPAAGSNANVENINPAAGGGAAGGACEQLPNDEQKEDCFQRLMVAGATQQNVQDGNKFLGGQP